MSEIDRAARCGSCGKARCHHERLPASRMPLRYKLFWIVLALAIAGIYGGVIHMIVQERAR